MADARYERTIFPNTHVCILPLTERTPDLLKSFIDDNSYNSGHGHAYEKYGVSVEEGAVVIVRPDHCQFLTFPLIHS